MPLRRREVGWLVSWPPKVTGALEHMELWQVSISGFAPYCTPKPYAHQHPIASYKSPSNMTAVVGF